MASHQATGAAATMLDATSTQARGRWMAVEAKVQPRVIPILIGCAYQGHQFRYYPASCVGCVMDWSFAPSYNMLQSLQYNLQSSTSFENAGSIEQRPNCFLPRQLQLYHICLKHHLHHTSPSCASLSGCACFPDVHCLWKLKNKTLQLCDKSARK